MLLATRNVNHAPTPTSSAGGPAAVGGAGTPKERSLRQQVSVDRGRWRDRPTRVILAAPHQRNTGCRVIPYAWDSPPDGRHPSCPVG